MTEAVTIRQMPDFKAINAEIVQQFNHYRDSDAVRRSHFFADRYENLYLGLDKVPAMQAVMEQAHQYAQQILKTEETLKRGFWFNLMLPGQVTQAHRHDDNDEVLSGVYYVDVPENSGDLLLTVESEIVQVTPETGHFVFFAPDISHEVTENRSTAERLSVGMNFGIDIEDD